MIERIDGMPDGTVGLRSRGKLSREDYTEVLEPALREGIDSGELRLLFVLESLDGLEPGAWIEDVETGLGLGFGSRSAWRRFALVTDVEWVAKAMRVFAWATPGEVRVFPLSGEDEARGWIVG